MDERDTSPETVVRVTPERDRLVRELARQALERPLANRGPFISAACDHDTALLSDVSALLDADGALRPSIAPLASTTASYRIIRELGRGGMGVVYLAEQLAPLRRSVAVKLINAAGDSKHVGARFEAERQALALMDHSSIAHVYDAGAATDGRPFFAMEYVAGISLTEFCDLRRIDIRGRLELFVAVCAAIQHAHQKGVIHRDIKPSNVLVTEQDGHPCRRSSTSALPKLRTHSWQSEHSAPSGAVRLALRNT